MIEILLATYNGGRHLPEQLDSVLAQTHREWRLLVHDDGSTDDTLAVLQEYRRRAPDRIVLLEDNVRGLGAKGNFAHLLAASRAEHVMFCDQDDIWLPEKVALTHAAMMRDEATYGPATPLGIFTDLEIVGDGGEPIAASGWAHLRVGPWLAESPRRLAVRNCVVGCALMVNRRAIEMALPIPPEARMHDWWLALVTLVHGGHLTALPTPTLRYRQHAANTVGARRFGVLHHLLAAANVPRFLRNQELVFRMARRSGAINSRTDFLIEKLSVLARAVVERP